MLRSHHHRRRSPTAPQLCAAAAMLLLLLSLAVLHSRLSLGNPNPNSNSSSTTLFHDADNDAFDGNPADDRIDELDRLDGTPTTDESASVSGSGGGLFWDHPLAVARVGSGSDIPDPDPDPDRIQSVSFGSDDQPVDGRVRTKLDPIRGVEDALMVKGPLRKGWVRWLEEKGDFLRSDPMLRSNLEPNNHPLLQDPDIPGVISLTQGDLMVQEAILKEMEKVPFGGEMVRIVRVPEKLKRSLHLEKREAKTKRDGRRWGYYPGIDVEASFSEFVEKFFEIGRCGIRVFMVWNSPLSMYGVRHQRGLESLLRHHRDACVLMLSETMELEFFKGFVKDGFKVAVAMPNLDELLSDTPTHVFLSVWSEWRKTKHYPIHYSELIRLAALYKYGGVYLDSDVIVLKPLHSLRNSFGIEDQRDENSSFNGAVMVFEKQSPFLMECLGEFYSTYDDTSLRGNGADLLTRVMKRLYDTSDTKLYGRAGYKTISMRHPDIYMELPASFFPISRGEITRYFVTASDENVRTQEEVLFRRILKESITFHFWNGLTSALVPEASSLVERLLNHNFLKVCNDEEARRKSWSHS